MSAFPMDGLDCGILPTTGSTLRTLGRSYDKIIDSALRADARKRKNVLARVALIEKRARIETDGEIGAAFDMKVRKLVAAAESEDMDHDGWWLRWGRLRRT